MALVVPNEGELQLLDKMVKAALSADENYILKVFQNDYVPDSTTSTSSFTEASFTNYVAKTLTRAGWSSSVTNLSGQGETSYATQSWTCGASGNTIYGYWIEGATSGKVLWAERFSVALVMLNADIVNIVPKFTLQSDN